MAVVYLVVTLVALVGHECLAQRERRLAAGASGLVFVVAVVGWAFTTVFGEVV